ncbi:MAG: hypothetical protein KGL42_15110 [Betaproteobacteria bacterium]|nr:hypothetical protein [Betaproteobacteria bacterium]
MGFGTSPQEIQNFQTGRLAFGSVTPTTAATAATLLTITGDKSLLVILNSLDTDCSLTYNGSGTAVEFIRLEAGESTVLDLNQAGKFMRSAKVIGAYNNGSAPTAGSIRVTAI